MANRKTAKKEAKYKIRHSQDLKITQTKNNSKGTPLTNSFIRYLLFNITLHNVDICSYCKKK